MRAVCQNLCSDTPPCPVKLSFSVSSDFLLTNLLFLSLHRPPRARCVCRQGGGKTFHGAGSSQSQSIFRDAETSRGAKEAKFVPLCTKKGRRRKNINRNRARGARFHLSYLYVFQGYMHFLQTLHSWNLKFDNQRG